jgi:eukaryotic-like serine/threonine-protein kinase
MNLGAPLPREFGPYRLLRRLGRGGMAEVYLAAHEPMPGAPRLVAIKQILPDLAEDETFLEMFLDEARVLSGLYHPNLDHVVDVGEHDGVPYMVLDYIPGRDLAMVLRRHDGHGLLPLEVSVHVAARVAAGLAHAHGRKDAHGRNLGIVHRDLSPENIIITFEGTVKVVDFGVARGIMRALQTAPGLIKGKPAYMAPEQILARSIDHRADIFALGVLLYRLTVGKHPFGVEANDERTFKRLLEVVPAPPHLVRADYPRALSAVVMKTLERDAARRHAHAEALLADLESVMRDQGWFPSDSRLARLMAELFPEVASSARRLAADPHDAAAASQASYLSTADIRIDLDDEDDEETAAVTRPIDRRMEEEPTVTESLATPTTDLRAATTSPTFSGQTQTQPTASVRIARREAATEEILPGELKGGGGVPPLPKALPTRKERGASPFEDAMQRGHAADSLPPPPLDSRLLPDPEETVEASISAFATHSALHRPDEDVEPEDDRTAVDRPRPPPPRLPADPEALSRDVRLAGPRLGSTPTAPTATEPDVRPPWRHPTGLLVTAVIAGAVISAILLSVCGS